MKRQCVQRAYQNVRPDEEAKVRMLRNILLSSEISPTGKDDTMKRRRMNPFMIAAIIALIAAMTITAFAADEIAGWFKQYFAKQSDAPLTQEQIEYIEENEQIVAEAQVQNGWTVELRSALTDGEKAYIIIGVTAPEDVILDKRVEDGAVKDWYNPGNSTLFDSGDIVIPSVPAISMDQNYYYQSGRSWVEDGDGLANTKNLVISLNLAKVYRDEPCGLEKPFAPEIDFTIHIEDIVHEYEDEAYLEELMNGKYAGQTDVMLTNEETQRLYKKETLVEGTWEFTVNFAAVDEGIELLSEPVTVHADIWRNFGDSIEDYAYFREDITVTSVILRPLTVTISYEDCNGGPTFSRYDTVSYVVMKDGSKIALNDYGSSGVGGKMLEAESPIILEEVDHILLADGTKLMAP